MTWHSFRGEVWEHSPGDPGSWHFVSLPPEVAADVALEAGPREGFGSIRVEVRTGATSWRTSLFPDAAAGTLVLPLEQAVRRAEGLHAGAACDVGLRVVAGEPPVRG